jgi:hypothetical protein
VVEDLLVTNQSKFSVIIGIADATFAMLLGAPVGVGILLGVLTYGASLGLFVLDSMGKLFKE